MLTNISSDNESEFNKPVDLFPFLSTKTFPTSVEGSDIQNIFSQLHGQYVRHSHNVYLERNLMQLVIIGKKTKNSLLLCQIVARKTETKYLLWKI
jgi:hypothetical protein